LDARCAGATRQQSLEGFDLCLKNELGLRIELKKPDMSWSKLAIFAILIAAAVLAAIVWPAEIAVDVIIPLTAAGLYAAWLFRA
jgi:hypothetical protein